MALNIIRASEAQESDATTCLAYGLPRTGKTQFGASGGDDTAIIDLGGGVIPTLGGATFKKMVNTNPLIINIADDYDEKGISLVTAFDKVGSAIDELVQKRKELGWNTLTIDEGTALQSHALIKAVKFNFDTKKTDTWSNVVKKYDFMMAIMPDMGAQRSILEQFCEYYCNLAKKENFNFIMLAHEKDTYTTVKMGQPKEVDKVGPYFVGESAKVIPGYFDWVLRFEALSGGSSLACRARTTQTEKLIAGVRTGGVFEDYILNPNFKKMTQQMKDFKNKTQTK